MKNILFGVLVLVLGITFTTAGFGQDKSKTEQKKETSTKTEDQKVAVKENSGVFNTVCPVSGEEINPEKTYTYKGVTYALCCNSCLKKFKADPEKYIPRLSEDGKSLKKKK